MGDWHPPCRSQQAESTRPPRCAPPGGGASCQLGVVGRTAVGEFLGPKPHSMGRGLPSDPLCGGEQVAAPFPGSAEDPSAETGFPTRQLHLLRHLQGESWGALRILPATSWGTWKV